jgi:hypothetical protein
VSRGVLGCHVDGVDGWWARLRGRLWIIAPSRFGVSVRRCCQRQPRPASGACALLPVDLGTGRAVVLGVSAGSGSVLEFGLRPPYRVSQLIVPTDGWEAGVTGSSVFARCSASPSCRPLFSWTHKRLRATAFSPMMAVSGVPAARKRRAHQRPAARQPGHRGRRSRSWRSPAQGARTSGTEMSLPAAAGPWAGCHLSWGRWALACRPVQPYAPRIERRTVAITAEGAALRPGREGVV